MTRGQQRKKMVTGHGPTLLEQISRGVGNVAKLASAVAPIVAAINTEAKYVDNTETLSVNKIGGSSGPQTLPSTLAAGGGVLSLTDMIQGVTDQTRIGNSILGKDFQIRLAIDMPVDNTKSIPEYGCFARFILVCWKTDIFPEANSAIWNKVLETPSNIYSPVNKDYSDQFVILKDKHFVLQAPQSVSKTDVTTSYTPIFKSFKIYQKTPWHLHWGSANADANPSTGHIFGIFMTTSTQAVGVTYYSRFNYTDN